MDKYSDENILDIPDEKYEIKTNVSMNLSKELGLPIFTYTNTNDWKPPETHGLENCNQIIPYYYVSQKKCLDLNIDYYKIIKDDIRNFRSLNPYQLDYIKTLSHEDKNELFDIFNDCIRLLVLEH